MNYKKHILECLDYLDKLTPKPDPVIEQMRKEVKQETSEHRLMLMYQGLREVIGKELNMKAPLKIKKPGGTIIEAESLEEAAKKLV